MACDIVGHLTSNYVFAESVTVISMRTGHGAAINFIERMQSPDSTVVIERATEELADHAIGIFGEQTSKNTSFIVALAPSPQRHNSWPE